MSRSGCILSILFSFLFFFLFGFHDDFLEPVCSFFGVSTVDDFNEITSAETTSHFTSCGVLDSVIIVSSVTIITVIGKDCHEMISVVIDGHFGREIDFRKLVLCDEKNKSTGCLLKKIDEKEGKSNFANLLCSMFRQLLNYQSKLRKIQRREIFFVKQNKSYISVKKRQHYFNLNLNFYYYNFF